MNDSSISTRRLAAVWVADIVGFTALSTRDSSLAQRQLERFRELTRSVAGDQPVAYRGDAAMAEFGTAEAAVRTVNELVEQFFRCREEFDTDCELRVGIHLGEVAGSADEELYGAGLDVATRLQEVADPGEILISEDVQRQLRNKPEFFLEPAGVRSLRGLDEPLATYGARLRRDTDKEKVSLGRWLSAAVRSRRTRVMASVTGIYFATLWTAVEIAHFVEARYQLSPNLTDVVLASLLLVLPSVLLVAYYHSGPTKQRIPLPEKVGVPANLIVASIIVVFAFGAQDIGAVMQTVEVVDEEGQVVERQVPKSEYRKRLAVYPFQAPAGEDAWMGHGFALSLVAKFSQDIFLQTQSASDMAERLKQAGFSDGMGMPSSLQREIAQERHLGHFIAGIVERTNADGVRVTLALHDSRTGRAVAEHAIEAATLQAAADRASDLLKQDLGLPHWHLADMIDMPAAEVLTGSEQALRAYTDGVIAATLHDDYGVAGESLEVAVELDPTFAIAHLTLFGVHFFNNDPDQATKAIEQTMAHAYRLPERLQILARHNFYYIKQDIERAYAVIDMGAELYPEDIQLLMTQAQLDTLRDRRERAISIYLRVMELNPQQHELLKTVASLSEALGRVEDAAGYLREYTKRFSDDHSGFLSLGDLHRRNGEFDKAAAAYERAALLRPDDSSIVLRHASVERNRGNFDTALQLIEEGIASARTPQQRHAALNARRSYYQLRGQMQAAIRDLQDELAVAAEFEPPVGVLISQLRAVSLYVEAGMVEAAGQILEQVAAQLEPPWDMITAIGRAGYALAIEDADAIEASVPALEQMIEAFQLQVIRSMPIHARGRMHELRGEYDEAIRYYEEEQRASPSDRSITHQIARCLRGLGRYGEAISRHQEALRFNPMNPRIHYEYALTLRHSGDLPGARRHLETALQIWEPADPEYRRAKLAQETLTVLADG